MRLRFALVLALLPPALGACIAPQDAESLEIAITQASEVVFAGRFLDGAQQLEELLPTTLGTPREELRVEYYLTQAHLAASLGNPFLEEPASGVTRTLGAVPKTQPSPTAHLVALVYHASAARALLDKHEGGLDRAQVEGNLRLATGTTLARLGFHDIAGRAVEGDPELLSLERFKEVLLRYELPRELTTWLAVMAFDAHKNSDQLTAYRFALLAIEGDTRFGQALPATEVARLEDWILNGARLRFVCPESGTPYVPGARRSPRSGIAHYEYVPATR